MKIATQRLPGQVIVERVTLEGASVTVWPRMAKTGSPFLLRKAELFLSIAEADRGNGFRRRGAYSSPVVTAGGLESSGYKRRRPHRPGSYGGRESPLLGRPDEELAETFSLLVLNLRAKGVRRVHLARVRHLYYRVRGGQVKC